MAGVPAAIFAEAETVSINDEAPSHFTAAEAEHIDSVPENASGLYCEEPGCNNELTYSGRGRRPKKCAEHKRGTSTGKADRSPGSQVPRGLAKIRQDITEAFYVAGLAVTPYDRYDAAVLIGGGPKVADSLVMLAARYPHFRQWLEKGGDGMLWVKVVMGLATVAVPIGAHHGLIPMDEKVAYQKFIDPSVEL